MSKYTNEHKKYIINNIMRWLLFGVIIVASPPLFTSWYKTIVGRFVNYYDILPDILLIVLSICCNSINTCIDSTKKIAYLLRWIFCIILGFISVGCWGLYFIIYFGKEFLHKLGLDAIIDIDSINLIDSNMSEKLFYAFTIIIIICTFIGSIIEFRTAKSDKSFVKN